MTKHGDYQTDKSELYNTVARLMGVYSTPTFYLFLQTIFIFKNNTVTGFTEFLNIILFLYATELGNKKYVIGCLS